MKRCLVSLVLSSHNVTTRTPDSSQGAPFTYDSRGYSQFVRQLRSDLSSPIPFPTFEHVIKDPVPSPHPVLPQHRIIIIEGLYTLLDEPEWRVSSQEMDIRIYVRVDRAVARDRCIRRNFAAGLAVSEEATTHRGELCPPLWRA